mgnify:CR=1 FL=1
MNYRYTDFYYIDTIIDVFYKLLTMYDFFFTSNKTLIVGINLNFIFKAIQEI